MSDASYENLKPGTIIEFGDISEIPQFEDGIATTIDAEVSQKFPLRSNRLDLNAWRGRTAITGLIRPPKFNGSVVDIKLEVMEDPYEQLVSADDRGWSLGRGRGRKHLELHLSERSKSLTELYRGFKFTADAKSSGRGTIGQILTEMWYYPLSFNAGQQRQRASNAGGCVVRRVVAKPIIEAENFQRLDEQSRRVGFKVLQSNMRHPIIQQMHN